MRVFCGGIGTETNTFSPLPTSLSSFKDREYFPAGQHPDTISFCGAPLWVARQQAKQKGWTLIEGLITSAQPAGITTRDAYETLRDELLNDLKQALPVDVVLLGLHGAMVADGYNDCEGDLMAHVRDLVGPNTIIGAELDPHGHLSQTMVDSADVMVFFKEYPHTDAIPRAEELVALCEQAYTGKINPCVGVVDCEMVVPIHTTRDPAQSFVRSIQEMEGKDGVLSISLVHGFATGDVPDMGTKVLVYTDGNPEQAQQLAEKLAQQLIAMREQLLVPYMDIGEAVQLALQQPEGPVVLADRPDNPGSGAPGDATYVLQYLIDNNIGPAALGPMWDPVAARIAFDAGVGATLSLRIGGKIGPLSGQPLDVTCKVMAVKKNLIMTGLSGGPVSMGDCALVRVYDIDVLLVSVRNQAMNIDIFTQMGCDLSQKRVVVVKSAQHFYASFSTIAKAVFYIGGIGVATSNWTSLPYKNIRKPKWPL